MFITAKVLQSFYIIISTCLFLVQFLIISTMSCLFQQIFFCSIPEQAWPSNYQGPQYLQLELSEKDKEWIVKHYSEMLTPADSGMHIHYDSNWLCMHVYNI